ncbi:MAG: tRNA 2-thiouridine(34) synthase MnmA [Bacteroidia bacterium]|nr:tRNA 2-thiouridine(34) synthase MnmA [Bacteroidia bacterium]
MEKKRIVVGMSGGIDSSVAAGILVEAGHDVIGVTIKTYNYDDIGGNAANDTSCCSLDGINDAREVCAQLGIPHYVFDFSQPFRENVIDRFIATYMEGSTPNPCVICNRKIKWEELIRKGMEIGADVVAMGHYARLGFDPANGRRWISRGRDSAKDQSYALWAVSQESLACTVLPLGDWTKAETRAWAESRGLRTAVKRESYEICFIPDNDYTRFLRENVKGLEQRVAGGSVLFEGKEIGRHDGYPFYTIGQRRGLNVAAGEALYVTGIDAASNTVTVGRKNELLRRSCVAGDVTMQKYPFPEAPVRVEAKIRYKDTAAPATLYPLGNGRIRIEFDEAKSAITRGQSTVWYDGEDVVGGGVIEEVPE